MAQQVSLGREAAHGNFFDIGDAGHVCGKQHMDLWQMQAGCVFFDAI